MNFLLTLILLASTAQSSLGYNIPNELFPEPQSPGERPYSVPLNFINGVPTVAFSVGTPEQQFVGIFDTSSVMTLVTSDNCPANDANSRGNEFQRANSSTNRPYQRVLDLDYADGEHVKVRPELDDISFLNGKVRFPGHIIGEVLEVDYKSSQAPVSNARIGLGDYLGYIRSLDGAKRDQYPSGATGIPSRGFSTKGDITKRAAGDDRSSTGYSSSGSPNYVKRSRKQPVLDFRWVFGVDDSMYQSPLYMMPLYGLQDQSHFWKLPVCGFRFTYGNVGSLKWQSKKEHHFPLKPGAFGQIHSSSPHILVPSTLAKKINENVLGAKYDPSVGLYSVDCAFVKSGPWLDVQLAELDAKIPSNQYIFKSKLDPRQCYSSIVAGPDDTNVYLGGPFFRSFYLVFDFGNQKIGVAQSAVSIGLLHPTNPIQTDASSLDAAQ